MKYNSISLLLTSIHIACFCSMLKQAFGTLELETELINVDDERKNRALKKDIASENTSVDTWDKNGCDLEISQIHLAYGHDAGTEMSVSFSTPLECGPELEPVVLYWEKGGKQLFTSIDADKEMQQYNNTCVRHHKEFVENEYSSPFIHHVRLKKLKPNTQYFYRIVLMDDKSLKLISSAKHETSLRSEGSDLKRSLGHTMSESVDRSLSSVYEHLSSIYSFKTAPRKGEGYGTFRFRILADYGHSTQVIKHAKGSLLDDNDKDMIILAGDVVYQSKKYFKWDKWFNDMQPLLANAPLMASVGNVRLQFSTE